MAKDWSRLVALAERLIENYGREVTLYKKSNVFTDASKPWLGPVDRISSDTISVTAKAVFIDGGMSETRKDEELIRRNKKKFIVFTETDIRDFSSILDDGKIWQVDSISILKPGTTTIVFEVMVKQ